MAVVTLAHDADFDGWRDAARLLALAGTPAETIEWRIGAEPGIEGGPAQDAPTTPGLSVPRSFLDLARMVVCHRRADRFERLYSALLRLKAGGAGAQDPDDPEKRRLEQMARSVQRDLHETRTGLRFVALADGAGSRAVAWHEPGHHTLRANAEYFARREAGTPHWSILTPELSLHSDLGQLTTGPGIERGDDAVEEIWQRFLGQQEASAGKERARRTLATAAASDAGGDGLARTRIGDNSAAALTALREEAMSCRRCPLWKPATQTVFGEGSANAPMMLVGEQPGDQEDLAGRPFVGPAGQLLDRCLAEAGIDRSQTYVTNAVKHFKFEPRGKRRIHMKPQAPEIEACHWWIDQERMIIKPRVTVALGASAARSLLGRVVTIGRTRGQPIELADGGECWVTIHPSYLLRIDDPARAEAERDAFVADLKRAAARMKD
jgi:DNA polymerase